jgi:hypothetical protein
MIHRLPASFVLTKIVARASRVAQWLRAPYCSASCAIRVPGFAPRLCHNRPRPGGLWGDASSSGLWEELVGRDVLVSSRTSDSRLPLTKVARCTVYPPTHWCGWLPGWMRAVLRSSTAGRVVYRRTHDFQPGVVAMRQDSSYYNNWIRRNWGGKFSYFRIHLMNIINCDTFQEARHMSHINQKQLAFFDTSWTCKLSCALNRFTLPLFLNIF